MKKEWRHPFWENYQKDRITAKLVILHDDGKETASTATVAKYTAGGALNPDFEEVIRQNSVEAIDKNTKEREERHKQRRETQKKADKEREQAKKLEMLFNAKLEVFEIPEIKDSNNRKLKAKIRKSKNQFELMAWTTLLLKEQLENAEAGTTV